jgi:hypothetical protein
MNYTFGGKTKILSIILMVVGLAAIIYGAVATPERLLPNLLLNGFLFTAIAIAGTVFVAVHYAGQGGWYSAVKRVPEAFTSFLPIGMAVLLGLICFDMFSNSETFKIWEWMSPEFQESDRVYKNSGKAAWLSNGFYLARMIGYMAIWIGFSFYLRKLSRQEDVIGGVGNHRKSMIASSIFLVLFGVTSSTSAWDWLMSIDVHWFSTLFGWYVFAGLFVSGICMITLIVLHLKRQGLMPWVNENHVHDLTKFMFGVSIFWTYLWFSQYMLIWYSNIPEEINYFLERFNTNYRFITLTALILNFVFPLLVLMHRYAKRNYGLVTFAACIIIFGHYLDLFQIIMPGTVKDKWAIGFTELGMFAGFIGLFLFVVLGALSKHALAPKNHPFLNEAKQHHI